MDVEADRLREVCERYGVASLEVFGSVARNEDRQNSDVDLLYVLKPDTRLGFRLFDLEDDLAALFGRPVDLIARNAINRYIREQVLADSRSMRRELLLLREMRDAALAIRDLVGERTAEEVDAEALRRSALLWHFTVLGEAASQIPVETKDAHPQIAWRGATRRGDRAVPGSHSPSTNS